MIQMIKQTEKPKVTVLLAEDNELVRLTGLYTLNDAGFDVIEAGSADEALEKFEQHPEVDVLLTDIEMPGKLDGLDLAREINQRRPDILLLVISGRQRPSRQELPEAAIFLAKPYGLDKVVPLIQKRTGRGLN
jgi:CheY-like chemotaxis protein